MNVSSRYIFSIVKSCLIFLFVGIMAVLLKPELFYQAQQPSFLSGISFYSQNFNYPGGIADYFSLFVMQFFYFNWIGVFIIAVFIWVTIVLMEKLLNTLNQNNPINPLLSYIPVLMLLFCFSHYNYPFSIVIRFIMVMAALRVLFAINVNLRFKTIYFLLCYCLLFYLAGGPASMLFSIGSVIYFLYHERGLKGIIISLIIMICAVSLPYISFKYLFNITITDAYQNIVPTTSIFIRYSAEYYNYILFALLPIIVGVSLFIKFNWLQKFQLNYVSGIQNGLVIVAACTIFYFTYNKEPKILLLSDYYSEREEWHKVIDNALKSKRYDERINVDYNRASFHTGQLTENLFKYSQLNGAQGLFYNSLNTIERLLPNSDLYFDLGYISESQHWAFEAQTQSPYNPRVLKRIIVNSIILGEYIVAEEFLQVLDKNFLYKKWVNQYSEYIRDTSKIQQNETFLQKRLFMPVNALINYTAEDNLYILLQKNQANKMAYEYIQLYFLLTDNLNDFYYHLPAIKTYGYNKLPRIFEEGLLLYYATNNLNPMDFPEFQIQNTTMMDFQNFNRILEQNNWNNNSAKKQLKQLFADTYWYFKLYVLPQIENK